LEGNPPEDEPSQQTKEWPSKNGVASRKTEADAWVKNDYTKKTESNKRPDGGEKKDIPRKPSWNRYQRVFFVIVEHQGEGRRGTKGGGRGPSTLNIGKGRGERQGA